MATTFAFQMRAYAAAHFEWDEGLKIEFPNNFACFLQSEYTGGDDGRAYPVTLHGEVRGDFETLDVAQQRLSALIGGDILPVIALAANAALATPMAVACFGVDLTEPRSFLGYRTPGPKEFFPPGKRRIDMESLPHLLNGVGTQPETQVLRRAIEAYRHALEHWIPEERLVAGEYLYIAAETLSRYLVASRAVSRGPTPKNLAKASGLRNAKKLRAEYLREIFGDDQDALRSLEKASNGFEHGYMATGEVRGLMDPVLERSFACIRFALIKASGVDVLWEIGDLTRRRLSAVLMFTSHREHLADVAAAEGTILCRRLDFEV